MKELTKITADINDVLFDKDGTLLKLDKMWTKWTRNVKEYLIMNKWSEQDGIEKFIKMIGIEEKKVIPDSPISVASENEMTILFAYHIFTNGVDWKNAVEASYNAVDYANSRIADDDIELIEGAYEFLKELYYTGKKIGVITADTEVNTRKHFESVDVLKWIDFIIGSDSVKRSKPFPDMLDMAEEKYGVNMEKAMFFGDSEVDVRMATLKCVNKIVSVKNIRLKTDFYIEDFKNIYIEKGNESKDANKCE